MVSAICYAVATAILVSRLIEGSRVWARCCIYILLVFNPFVIDYLVPARGYAPALACEMAVLLLIYRKASDLGVNESGLIQISIIAALGVCFNYSFLFTFSALIFCCFLLVSASVRPFRWSSTLLTGVRLFGPFVAVIILICGQNILTMPRSEIAIGWGGRSFAAMFASFSQLSFNYPNPFLTPPGLMGILTHLSRVAPSITIAMLVTAFVLVVFYLRRRSPGLPTNVPARERFVLLALCALVLSLALHAALFFILGVKLPRTRTGIHLIPLITLVAASPLFAFREGSGMLETLFRRAAVAATGIIAICFAFSQHFSYFQEWKWNADVCTATDTALSYATILNTKDVRISWEFDGAGNFYGEYLGYGTHRLNQVPESELLADDQSNMPTIYILSRRVWARIDKSNFGRRFMNCGSQARLSRCAMR